MEKNRIVLQWWKKYWVFKMSIDTMNHFIHASFTSLSFTVYLTCTP